MVKDESVAYAQRRSTMLRKNRLPRVKDRRLVALHLLKTQAAPKVSAMIKELKQEKELDKRARARRMKVLMVRKTRIASEIRVLERRTT